MSAFAVLKNRHLVGALIAFVGILAGCGTTTVRMKVVRPAVINARPYGGMVTVQGIAAGHPDWIHVAAQLRQELKQQILGGFGGVVKLTEYGGGLMITGRLQEYGMVLTPERREATCADNVRDPESGITRVVNQPCVMRRNAWSARVTVLMKVTTSTGQVLFLRRIIESSSGRTVERRGGAPLPDSHRILQRLRALVAARMAHIVVPHRATVSAVLYDCPKLAEAACQRGAANLARSRYDEAIAEYDRALIQLTGKPEITRDDLAKVHWNKAIVFKYSRRFDEALAALDQALGLDPGNGTYQRQRREVVRARDQHVQLIEQGLGGP